MNTNLLHVMGNGLLMGVREGMFLKRRQSTSTSWGAKAISFMCGDHPMIALMQALQLKVITGDQYASLMSLYMDVDDFSFGMVVLEKSTGDIMYDMYTPRWFK